MMENARLEWRYGEAGLGVLAATVVEAAIGAGMKLDQCPLVSNVFVNGAHEITTVCGLKFGTVRFNLVRVANTFSVYGTTFTPWRDATTREIAAASFADQCLRALEERGWRFIHWQ